MSSRKTQYKKYKRAKSAIFNGSPISNYNLPSYYQQKGRSIQPKISRMYNPPMEMPSTQSLHRMYNTLVQYKYKFPSSTGNIPEPFILTSFQNFASMFPGEPTESHKFGSEELLTIMNAIQNKPVLPSGYHYNYQLIKIGMYNDYGPAQENKQFTIDWYSNLIAGQLSINNISIFVKSVDASISTFSYKELYLSSNSNQITYIRAAVTGGGSINITQPNVGNNDPDPTDNYSYPYIDTDSGENALYYGYLQINPQTGYEQPGAIRFVLNVLCIPTRDN